jgi:excisionase family DNA binding protein
MKAKASGLSNKITISRKETAEALGIDIQTVDRLISSKCLRASKIGRRVLVRVADIERMLDANTVVA